MAGHRGLTAGGALGLRGNPLRSTAVERHVRLRHPNMPEGAILREARKLYEGPSHPDPLGPVGRHLRDARQPRIMADIKAHP